MERVTGAERSREIALLALKIFKKPEINKHLAKLANKKLSPDVIKQALIDAAGGDSLPKKDIEGAMTELAQKAINQINEKKYGDLVRKDVKEIIKLGLAIYGYGDIVKALFE
jgi:hypothetical protein